MKRKNRVRRRVAFTGVVLAGVTLAGMAAIPASADEPRHFAGPLFATREEALADLPRIRKWCENNTFGPGKGLVFDERVVEVPDADFPGGVAFEAGLKCRLGGRTGPTNPGIS